MRRGWVETREASRVVTVSPEGQAALLDRFGISSRAWELEDQASVAA